MIANSQLLNTWIGYSFFIFVWHTKWGSRYFVSSWRKP